MVGARHLPKICVKREDEEANAVALQVVGIVVVSEGVRIPDGS